MAPFSAAGSNRTWCIALSCASVSVSHPLALSFSLSHFLALSLCVSLCVCVCVCACLYLSVLLSMSLAFLSLSVCQPVSGGLVKSVVVFGSVIGACLSRAHALRLGFAGVFLWCVFLAQKKREYLRTADCRVSPYSPWSYIFGEHCVLLLEFS